MKIPVAATIIILKLSLVFDQSKARNCEVITYANCKVLGYNMTYMPNQFHNENQTEAGTEVNQFQPLFGSKCSPDLQFLICSLYFPICTPGYDGPIPPCRSVCQRSKNGCLPILAQYGFNWPERLNCDRLPVTGGLCMENEIAETSTNNEN